MRTVDRIADVPAEARSAVMITDPGKTLPDDQVFVTALDVRDAHHGTYAVWIEQRGQWLDRVMPRVSVAEYDHTPAAKAGEADSRRIKAKARRRRAAAAKRRRQRLARASRASSGPPTVAANSPAENAEPMATAAPPLPKVVMFSTSWCPSCRMARDFFTQKGVRFVDIDVERNEEAARKMLAIQQANGFRAGAVPLIIVDGKAYQGFSRLQLEVAINNLGRQGSS